MHKAGLFGTGISDACGLSAGFGGGPAGDGTVCGQANPAGENRRWVLLRILVAAFVAVGMLRHFLPLWGCPSFDRAFTPLEILWHYLCHMRRIVRIHIPYVEYVRILEEMEAYLFPNGKN